MFHFEGLSKDRVYHEFRLPERDDYFDLLLGIRENCSLHKYVKLLILDTLHSAPSYNNNYCAQVFEGYSGEVTDANKEGNLYFPICLNIF